MKVQDFFESKEIVCFKLWVYKLNNIILFFVDLKKDYCKKHNKIDELAKFYEKYLELATKLNL